MRDAKHAAFTGRAGELTVAAQLLLRDISVFFPHVDTGCDLMTESGCRLQVKCAHLYSHKNGPRYSFPLPKTRRIPNSDKTTKLITRKSFAEVCHFVVFWGIEQNRFWVVPANLCDEVTGVELGLENNYKRFAGSLADMREMKRLGYSVGKIAKHYDMQRTSVQQFLDSDKEFIDETAVSQMRACEGRWDFILNFTPSAVAQEAPANEQKEQ
jgi:hypothetical protein